jgi:hypothetical protein
VGGDHGGGLSLFDDQDWTTYTAADGLLSNVIYDIDFDPSGGIWVGTSGGLNHQVGSRWLGYNQQAGLTGSQVYVLARDPMGFNQWLGTEAGLNRFTVQIWKPNQPVTPTSIAQPISPTLLFAPSKEQPPLIDAEAGRVYVSGQVDEQQQTLVLDADDGRLLARYDLSGPLALDSVHSRLYVEQPDQGELLIIDTQTNQLITTVAIPSAPFFISRGPTVDPVSGRVFVTRENVIYIIDPAQGKIVETMTSAITTGGTDTPPRLTQVLVDAPARILYYDAVVHGCFSSLGGDCSTYQIVSYDLTSGQVITHTEGHGLGQVFDGFMVYQDFRCPGASCSGFRALWQDGQPKLVSTNWLDYGGRMVFDPARHRIYEATGEQLRVYEADTLALTMILPQPMSGTLVRFDADQDALQFWVDDRLQPWPLSDLMPPSAQPLTASPTPTTPVRFAAVSPTWPTDPTLFAAWADPLYAPGQRPLPPGWNERYRCGFPSLLYISLPGNQAAASPIDRWSRPVGGLQDTCGLSTPLAISPDYGQDQTLLAGIDGLGIFKSVDGGQLWRPSGAGLRDMTAVEIELSSDFGRDQTAFARMKSGQLYGSIDGGESWQRLTEPASHPMYRGRWTALALSPEYGLDQTVLAIFSEYNQPDRLYQSTNDGATWSLVADVPERVS